MCNLTIELKHFITAVDYVLASPEKQGSLRHCVVKELGIATSNVPRRQVKMVILLVP